MHKSTVVLTPTTAEACPNCLARLHVESPEVYVCRACMTSYDIHIPEDIWVLNWVTGTIAISGLAAARHAEALASDRVEELMCVRSRFPGPAHAFRDVTTYFPLVDGREPREGYFDAAIPWLVDRIKREVKVLVYCAAGVSRSVTVAATALVRAHKAANFDIAVHRIVRARPCARPHPVLARAAQQWLGEIAVQVNEI